MSKPFDKFETRILKPLVKTTCLQPVSWSVRSTLDRGVWVQAEVIVLCFCTRHFTVTVPLYTQVYKWVLAILMLGVTLRWTHIPSRGGVEIFSVASSYRNPDKLQPGGPLGSHADFDYFLPRLQQAVIRATMRQSTDFLFFRTSHNDHVSIKAS